MKGGRRGPRRRDDVNDHDPLPREAIFADMVDELPGDDFDLSAEVRRMGLATSSNAYAMRRQA